MKGKIPAIYKKGGRILNFNYLNKEDVLKELNKNNKIIMDCDNDTLLINDGGRNNFTKEFNLSKLNYERVKTSNGIKELVPIITKDEDNNVLMFAYGSEETIKALIKTGLMHYYSRKRGWWLKGETSGNYQKMKSLRMNKKRDCLLATVEPKGPACHTNEYSCFHKIINISKFL